jgi:processive 1,2-diacylglycerol beta-glucosyltransferase
MTRRVLILSSRVGSGHIAAATALDRVLQRIPGLEVRNLDAMDLSSRVHKLTYSGLYFPMARVAPWLMAWAYQAGNLPFASEPVLPIWDRLNAAPLVRFIREYNPDIAICTHFMPAKILGQLIEHGQISSSLSIVASDYDLHSVWLCRTFTRYFVALEETKAHCCALGLPEDRIVVSGIPVDPAFEEPFDSAALLAKYGLCPQAPIVLISAGTSGNSSVRRVVEQLMLARRDLQGVVVCGRNKALRRQIGALVAPQAERFRVLGFSDEMPSLMRLATLFIGKPGGLTAAECMAAGLPMLIIEPLPGQEDDNSHHLLEEGAAMRSTQMTAIAHKVDRLLGQPGLLAQMRANARRFGRPGAARAIAEAVLAEHQEPVQLSREQRRRIIARAHGSAEVAPARRRADLGVALYDQATGRLIGVVDRRQYQFLRAHLAIGIQEAFDVDTAAIGRLAERGADGELLDLLRSAVGAAGSGRIWPAPQPLS